MSDNKDTQAKPHQYVPGDRVRILKPAQGVPETARFIGTIGTVRGVEAGDLFVEPDAAPNYANSWWYGPGEVEFVASAPPAPTPPGWFVVSEWCDDDHHFTPVHLVWSTSEDAACRSAGRTFDGHEPKARRIELPSNPSAGDRISLW